MSRFMFTFQNLLGTERKAITVRELLTHTSGLPPDMETKTDWHGQAEAITKACAEHLDSKPGTIFKYSDINFVLLGEIHSPGERDSARGFCSTRNLWAVENDRYRVFAVDQQAGPHRAHGGRGRQTLARRGP